LRASLLAILITTTVMSAAAGASTTGALFQDLGSAGCVRNLGVGGCAIGFGLRGPTDVAASPDGLFLYVAAQGHGSDEGAIAAFSRNPATGVVAQLPGTTGCIAEATMPTTAGHCTTGIGLFGADAVAVSPDGKFVYTAGEGYSEALANNVAAIAIFSRDTTTGALTQLPGASGCLTGTGGPNSDARCTAFAGELGYASDVVISPDGMFVYVSNPTTPTDGGVGNIDVFARNTTTGLLTFASCVKEVPGVTGCAPARATRRPQGLAFSPDADAKHLYLAASQGVTGGDMDGAVAFFDRNAATGALTQHAGAAGCINAAGDDGSGANTCATGRALHDARSIAVAPTGDSVYLAAQGAYIPSSNGQIGSLASFSRDPVTGDLAQLAGLDGCITQDGGNGYETPPAIPVCAKGRSFSPTGVAVSPDSTSVYLGSSGDPSAISTFERNLGTGALAQLDGAAGCVSASGVDATLASTCTLGNAIEGPASIIALAAAGRPGCVHVYSASAYNNALVTLKRQVECTPPAIVKPTATTGKATNVKANGATLNGTLDPGTADSSYVFEFGTTTSYGQQTVAVPVAATRSARRAATRVPGPRAVTAVLDGLQTGRTYHYRLIATNSAGVSTGTDVTFKPAKAAKKKPKSLKVTAKLKNGKLAVAGKLGLPAGVAKKDACAGKVTIQVKAGKKRLAKRTAKIKSSCKFSANINLAGKLGAHPRLKVTTRFGANTVLSARSGKTLSVKS
jgi:hypothetical protein